MTSVMALILCGCVILFLAGGSLRNRLSGPRSYLRPFFFLSIPGCLLFIFCIILAIFAKDTWLALAGAEAPNWQVLTGGLACSAAVVLILKYAVTAKKIRIFVKSGFYIFLTLFLLVLMKSHNQYGDYRLYSICHENLLLLFGLGILGGTCIALVLTKIRTGYYGQQMPVQKRAANEIQTASCSAGDDSNSSRLQRRLWRRQPAAVAWEYSFACAVVLVPLMFYHSVSTRTLMLKNTRPPEETYFSVSIREPELHPEIVETHEQFIYTLTKPADTQNGEDTQNLMPPLDWSILHKNPQMLLILQINSDVSMQQLITFLETAAMKDITSDRIIINRRDEIREFNRQ